MEEQYKKRFGDRRDARWVRDVPGLTTVMMHIMPQRTDAEVYLNDKIHEANHTMPHYKSVHHYVFTEEDMIKTTTLKIKRPKEQAHIEGKLTECGRTMAEMNGKNFDKMIKA